jgi:hypothetical protein
MLKDVTTVIDSLRDAAVLRCRERIERAALKAKGLLKDGSPSEKKENNKAQQYGVTSVLKRKHGL